MNKIDTLVYLGGSDMETQIDRDGYVYTLDTENSPIVLSGRFGTRFSSDKILTFNGTDLPFCQLEPYIITDDLGKIFRKLTGLQFSQLSLNSYGDSSLEPDELTQIMVNFNAHKVTDLQYLVRSSIDFIQKGRERFVVQGIGFGNDYSPLELETLNSDDDDTDEPWKLSYGFESKKVSAGYFGPTVEDRTSDTVSYYYDAFESMESSGNIAHYGKLYKTAFPEGIEEDTVQYVVPRLAIKRKIIEICEQDINLEPVMLQVDHDFTGLCELDSPADIHIQYDITTNNNGTKLLEYIAEINQEEDFHFISQGSILLNHKRM